MSSPNRGLLQRRYARRGAEGRRWKREDGPLSVGVFVDLKWSMEAGGHVKCWEHFAEAAAAVPEQLDLTVHFLGDAEEVYNIAGNVRYVTHRPALSTSRFRCMAKIPAQTDLAPVNLHLLPYLKDYQLVHTTGAFFALSKTARYYARRHSVPLVNSIHTDTPAYTRCFAAEVIRRMTGDGLLRGLLVDRLRLPERTSQYMLRKLDRYLARCDWVLVSRSEDLERVRVIQSEDRVSVLRRGVDKLTFHPRWRNRQTLRDAYGIPADRFLILYVGRLDAAKNVMTLARAARLLIDRGNPLQVMMVGKGPLEAEVRKLLGPAVTFPGVVPHSALGWLYASADLFAFPSETEVCPNVVLEARSSGLPVLLSARGGSAELILRRNLDGFLAGEDDPQSWARCLDILRRHPERRARAGAEARKVIDEEWPSWSDVLQQDLLPVWRDLIAEKAPR